MGAERAVNGATRAEWRGLPFYCHRGLITRDSLSLAVPPVSLGA